MKNMNHSALIPEDRKRYDEKIIKLDQEIGKLKTINQAAALNPSRRGSVNDEDQHQFWLARRSALIAPVPGSGTDLWKNAEQFFHGIMKIPRNELNEKSVEKIERITRGKRQGKIRDEVLIVFDNIATRDRVASYTSNLAGWRDMGQGPASFRLNIPDHLRSIFRTLETYGHYLKNKCEQKKRNA